MTRKAELIGGPQDGKMITIRVEGTFVRVPIKKRITQNDKGYTINPDAKSHVYKKREDGNFKYVGIE